MRLEILMEALDISAREMSRRIGLGVGALSRIFSGARGDRLNVDIAIAMIDVMGASDAWVFRGRGAPMRDGSKPLDFDLAVRIVLQRRAQLLRELTAASPRSAE